MGRNMTKPLKKKISVRILKLAQLRESRPELGCNTREEGHSSCSTGNMQQITQESSQSDTINGGS